SRVLWPRGYPREAFLFSAAPASGQTQGVVHQDRRAEELRRQLLVLSVALSVPIAGGFAGLGPRAAGGAGHPVGADIRGHVARPSGRAIGLRPAQVAGFGALSTWIPRCAAELVI